MSDTSIDLRDGYGPVSARLADRYEGLVRREVVEELVRQTWEALAAGARFTTYLSVLTTRVADERLRALLIDAG